VADYLAEPDAPGPGVLVVHDWFGLLPHVKGLCDQLAEAGFVALAPDLYDGTSTTDPEEAARLLRALPAAPARQRLLAAAESLRGRAVPARVGGTGFSMGGWLTLLVATDGALDAVVAYYAALAPRELAPIGCPVLLQLATVDEWDPPDTPERFAAWLRDQGTPVEVRTWPATEHSFANADARPYAPEQAQEAWSLTLEFLRRHLLPTTAGG
jgi:carboxymethylenebutenolidase